MIPWIITWVLLVATLVVSVFRNIKIREEAERQINNLEGRLRSSARVRSSLGPTYQERLAEEYKKRGIGG